MRVGIITPPVRSWDKLVDVWKRIESWGYDSTWTPDHFVNTQHPDRWWYEAWTTLAGLAVSTNRVRIGVAVTSVAFRNPAFLARQAMTVDHISHGRLEIGLGAGEPSDPSYDMAGVDAGSPSERVKRLSETVEILDQLLRNGSSNYRGEHYRTQDATMKPPPVQQPRPPFLIAAQGHNALRVAARFADKWDVFGPGGATMREAIAGSGRRIDALDEYCLQAGREQSEIRRVAIPWEAKGSGDPFASVDAFTDFVGAYRELGLEEFLFYYRQRDDEVLQRVGTDVLPSLRLASAEPA